jgi:hypothetical protein
MKRIVTIVSLLFLGVGMALWMVQIYSVRWEPYLRSELEKRAQSALGIRIHISEIAISFLHRIALKDVEIWDNRQTPETLLFRANEVALTASLIDLPRALIRRNPIEVIGLIQIDTPVATLSKDALSLLHARKSTHTAPPLWFALEWTQGTFQWKDPDVPHGAWSVYQSRGYIRFRGPRVEALARGGLEQAQSVDVHYSKLGRRWTAEARIFKGDIAGVRSLAEHIVHHSVLPSTWTVQGQFDFDLKAAGKGPVSFTESPAQLIQDAHLKLINAQLDPGSGKRLDLNGALALSSGRLELSAFTVKGENTQLRLSGHGTPFAPLPLFDLVTQGHIHRLALDNVHAQFRRLSAAAAGQPAVWELASTSLRLWDGAVTLKGTIGGAQTRLQLTGNDLSLQTATATSLKDALKGRLNASISIQGALEDLRTTGSFWITNLSWVKMDPVSIRGGLEITPTHFDLHGASDDEQLQIKLEGSHNDKSIALQHGLLQLREDTTLNGHGTYGIQNHGLHLLLDAKNISVTDDIPHANFFKGIATAHGTVEGPIGSPTLKVDAHSDNFQVNTSTPGPATASLKWTADEFSVDGIFGKTGSLQGALRFVRLKDHLMLHRFSLITALGKTDLKGEASWVVPPEGHPIEEMKFHGEGHFASLNEGSDWSAPTLFQGTLSPSNDWKGDVLFESPKVLIHRMQSRPMSVRIRWSPKEIQWDTLHWGQELSSDGSIHFTEGAPATLSGLIKAQDSDIARWQTWLWPQVKEPIRGLLTGAFVLSGTAQDPIFEFTGKLRKGLWRAFQFDTYMAGTWKKSGLEPLIVDGTIQSGGAFRFRGRISPTDKTASGSLDVNQFELKPLGASLSFPHSLEGKANATLTVSGPLNQLHLAGHFESSPLIYSGETPHPLKLQSFVMDLKLDPGENATRLTIAQALAKTQEEEIRLNPGSFVEFAGLKEARMQIGSEIRNLHLGGFTLFGGLDLNGTWLIKPQGFAIQGDVFTRSLFINDYQLEQGHVQASYYDRQLSFDRPRGGPALVTGLIDFKEAPQVMFKDFAVTGKEGAGLRLNGLVGPEKWNFSMSGQSLDLSTLGGLAGFPYSLDGSADVNIRGVGNLEHPNVEGTLDIRDGRVMGLHFQTGSAALAWQGQRMTFTRLTLSDPGRYTLTGAGVFPLSAKSKVPSADKTIDFSLRLMDSNLSLLQSITPEVKAARGSVQALLQIKGTSDAPELRGSLRVKNGDVEGAHYFRHVRDVQIEADFQGNNLVFSEFRGQSGKGEFIGGGSITFAGFTPSAYDLHLDIPSSKGVEVTVPELAIPESPLAKKLHFLTTASQCDVRGKATFKGPAEAPTLTADARLMNGHFTFPPSSKNPPPPGFMEWIRRITWDTTLHFTENAWFENELVEAHLNGDLAIKGPSDKLRVDGGMDIPEGKISYLGVEFNIQTARFDIRTTESDRTLVTTPYVRGIADSQVQSVDPVTSLTVDDTITLTINYAPINEIKPQLRSSSNPGLSQEKILARVSQLEVENLTPQERNSIYQQQMVRLLDTSLATPLARGLLKRTGLVDELHVTRSINPSQSQLSDPNNPSGAVDQSAAVGILKGTKYTVAKNFTSRVQLGYGVRFDEVQALDVENKLVNKLDLRSDVELSYRLLNNLYFKGSFDLPNTSPGYLPDRRVTIEPRWRFGWWGNTNKPKQKPKPPSSPAGTNTTPPSS